ncbi:hypothetical protein CXIVA_12820 [Clostridium sp. SY8519]|nr:hypothetical protein CXIVA_12820 [Clostridium sp. SY8519]
MTGSQHRSEEAAEENTQGNGGHVPFRCSEIGPSTFCQLFPLYIFHLNTFVSLQANK